jgi:hypothetical protein
MRQRSPAYAAQINDKLLNEGFEAAGKFAAFNAQCGTLNLHPCQCPPCAVHSSGDPDLNIYGRRPREIELRNALPSACRSMNPTFSAPSTGSTPAPRGVASCGPR